MKLLEAASCGDLGSVTTLLESIADTTQVGGLLERDNQGYTAAAWACCHDDLNILRILLEKSSAFLEMSTYRGASLLHLSCQNKSFRCLQYLLNEIQTLPQECQINATNCYLETALHVAAAIGDIVTVEMLLKAGACPVIKDQYGRSPQSVAIQNGYAACAEVFDKYMTEVDQIILQRERKEEHQNSIVAGDLISLESRRQLHDDLITIVKKSHRGSIEVNVKSIFKTEMKNDKLDSSKAFKAEESNDEIRSIATPIIPALSKFIEYPGDIDAIRNMLESGLPFTVNPAGKDMYGMAALHKFAAWNKVDMLRLLLPHLSKSEINSAGGPDGFSALHHCIDMNAPQALEYLLSYPGVDCDAKDNHERTFRDLARQRGLIF